MGLNRVAISGNLTRDPELRRTQSGMAILSFGVAVNDRRKNNQTGEWEDYPNFIDCSMFGNRAESVYTYLNKGVKVAVEGKLRYSAWEKDGQKKSKIEVIVEEIEWLSSKAGGNNNGKQPTPQQVAQQQQMNAQAVAQMQAMNAQYQQAQQYQMPMQQGYAQPMPQQAPQPMQQPYAQPAPQQYQQPQTAPQTAPQPAQQPATPSTVIDYASSVYDDDIPF